MLVYQIYPLRPILKQLNKFLLQLAQNINWELSLKVHIKLKHENVQSFKCKDCDYVCKRSDYLTRHVRSIHENVRFQCHQCEYQATRKQYLESHIKKIHQKEDSIKSRI